MRCIDASEGFSANFEIPAAAFKDKGCDTKPPAFLFASFPPLHSSLLSSALYLLKSQEVFFFIYLKIIPFFNPNNTNFHFFKLNFYGIILLEP